MGSVSILRSNGSILKTIVTDGHDSGRMVETMTQELDPILEHCKRIREVRGVRTQDFLEGMCVAGVVPDIFVEQMIRENGGRFPEDDQIKRWLNDPANEPFRIWKGRV